MYAAASSLGSLNDLNELLADGWKSGAGPSEQQERFGLELAERCPLAEPPARVAGREATHAGVLERCRELRR